MKRRLLLLAALALPALAQADGGASTGGLSLALPRGARAAGMGSAYAAVASGADAVLWNPAGMNQLRAPQAEVGHLGYVQDVSDDYLALALPIYGLGAWGLGLNYLWAQDQGYDALGQATGAYTLFDFSARAALAVELPWDMHLGGDYKILRQGYDHAFSMGSGFDLGWQWRNLFGGLDLGATVSNAGTPVALGSVLYNLPLTFRGGAALRLSRLWLLAADYEFQPVDSYACTHLGLEGGLELGAATLKARGGYSIGAQREQGAGAGLAAGLGLALGRWQLDYAWAPMGDLGTAQRLSLTWSGGD